jgi:hypothetical protein
METYYVLIIFISNKNTHFIHIINNIIDTDSLGKFLTINLATGNFQQNPSKISL